MKSVSKYICLSLPHLTQFVLIALFLSSCETEITIDLPQPEEKIVVEGYIEPGVPPIITLTSTVPFYGNINFNELGGYYISDAEITVSDGATSVILTEYCLNELPEDIIPLVGEFLGLDLDSLGEFPVNVCLYTVPDIFTGAPAFIGEAGKSYLLNINTDGKTLTSSTTIPPLVPLDSIYSEPHDDPNNDSLVRLYVHLTDPPQLGNYYRYFTKKNDEPFYTGFASVFDDNIVNGQSFDFTLDRGISPNEAFDQDTYGYFWRGDTIILKWATIDYASLDFWRTLEYDSGTDGPFASATIISTNINGGLGIWCGYGATYDTLYVEEE